MFISMESYGEDKKDMARTLLTYSVLTEDVWGEKKQAIVRKIKHRGFDFSVSCTKSEKEEYAYLDSFVEFLFAETGIDARGNYFGDDNVPTFVSITIEDVEQKKAVIECYRRWKREIKPTVVW